MSGAEDERLLHEARARVLADLMARRLAVPSAVTVLDEACATRRWWVSQWPEGAVYVAGLVAQDVQDELFDTAGRWPLCLTCDDVPEHSLAITPDLGTDPVWMCEETGEVVAALGHLGSLRTA